MAPIYGDRPSAFSGQDPGVRSRAALGDGSLIGPSFGARSFIWPYLSLTQFNGFMVEVQPWHKLYQLPVALTYAAVLLIPLLGCADLHRSFRRGNQSLSARVLAVIGMALLVSLLVFAVATIPLTVSGLWFDLWFEPIPQGVLWFCGVGYSRGWPFFVYLALVWPALTWVFGMALDHLDERLLRRWTTILLFSSMGVGVTAYATYRATGYLFWEWNVAIPWAALGYTGYLPAIGLSAWVFLVAIGCQLILDRWRESMNPAVECQRCGYPLRGSCSCECSECGATLSDDLLLARLADAIVAETPSPLSCPPELRIDGSPSAHNPRSLH